VFTDVQTLVLSALLTWLMILTSSTLRSRLWTPAGATVAFSSRDQVPEPTAVAARADRAARNMLENLPLFLALMLAVRISGHTGSDATAGANVFFWARVVYWPLYLAGVPYLRSTAWAVSVAGLAKIALAALG
jgi:uncharacterized MAPEG superfamily protein